MTELETVQRAKLYMDKLAQGIDPITDRELVGDTGLNHVRMARCFFYVSNILQRVIDNGGVVGDNRKRKREFAITPQQLALVHPMPYAMRITEFTKLLYDAVGDSEMKQLNPVVITDWLLAKGFLYKDTGPEGKMRRIPTDAGRSVGISTRPRRGQYGEYLAILYDANAQQFLLDNFWSILKK